MRLLVVSQFPLSDEFFAPPFFGEDKRAYFFRFSVSSDDQRFVYGHAFQDEFVHRGVNAGH